MKKSKLLTFPRDRKAYRRARHFKHQWKEEGVKVIYWPAYTADSKEPDGVKIWKLLKSAIRASNPNNNAPLVPLGSDPDRLAAAMAISEMFKKSSDGTRPLYEGSTTVLEDTPYRILFDEAWDQFCAVWLTLGDADVRDTMKRFKEGCVRSYTATEWAQSKEGAGADASVKSA